MMYYEWTSVKIRRLRTIYLHETRQHFADRLGVHFTTIFRWEIGESEPQMRHFQKLDRVARLNNISDTMLEEK